MAHATNPIQSSQTALAVIEAPVATNFSDLPNDILFQILQRIWQPKDVANLNLVSKLIKSLNQESIVAAPRLEMLSVKMHTGYNPFNNHSYRLYIRNYSFNSDYQGVFDTIERQFPESMGTVRPRQLQPLTNEMWDHLLDRFYLLSTGYKLKALLAVSSSFRASKESTKRFYDALSPAVQTELRWQIWNANGQSSVDSDGIDRGLGFGEYIVDNEINSPLVKTAIRNYLSKFGVDFPANP